MSLPVWEQLAKTQNDATRIDEAIDEAIAAHNNDPGAHLGPDESLEAHREASVIDHPAESVPNDKLFVNSRAYVAIVDQESEDDFDTIQSALDYVNNLGGGNILIMPGDHFISGEVALDGKVSFTGFDKISTRIFASITDGDYFKYYVKGADYGSVVTWENLTIYDDGGGVFAEADYEVLTDTTLRFRNCDFLGGGRYLENAIYRLEFDDCLFHLSTEGAIIPTAYTVLRDCFYARLGSSGTDIFIRCELSAGEPIITMTALQDAFIGSRPTSYFGSGAFTGSAITGCTFNGWATNNVGAIDTRFEQNTFVINSTNYFNLTNDMNFIIGNRFLGGTGNRLRLQAGSDNNMVLGNMVGTAITNNGSNNVVANNITS